LKAKDERVAGCRLQVASFRFGEYHSHLIEFRKDCIGIVSSCSYRLFVR